MSNPVLAQEANSAGMAALKAGDAATAKAEFTRAAGADPDALPLWLNLAHACRVAGDHDEERVALDRALSIHRTDFTANLRKAQLLQKMGEESQALVAWSGVHQLAAQLPNLQAHIIEELAAGQNYSANLQMRLNQKIDTALSKAANGWDETDNRRMRAFVEHSMGRRKVYHNQCAGAYFPFLPEDEFFDRRHFPWLADLEANHSAIKVELEALLAEPGDSIRPYVQMEQGIPENPWSKLDGMLSLGIRQEKPCGNRPLPEHGGPAGGTASGPHSGPRAERFFLRTQAPQPHPAAHRRYQHARDHPSGA